MKILVIHASAGAGHQKAAEALFEQIKKNPSHTAVFVDSLDYTRWFYKKSYKGLYNYLIAHAPWAWGLSFQIVDVPWLLPFVRLARRIQNAFWAAPLAEYFKKEQFDYILSTHFMPTEVSAYLKRTGQIKSSIITIVTDFDVHSVWTSDGVDLYTGACESTRKRLLSLGIPDERIRITGIPIEAKFSRPQNKSDLKRKLNLEENIFTVLITMGSFGTGPIEELIEELKGFQVLVVCARNKVLFEKLSQSKDDGVKIYGFVDNMDELMTVADVMISKAGGQSISEALAKNLPVIFFNAIPGQEVNNIRMVKDFGVGSYARQLNEILSHVKILEADKKEYEQLQERIKRLARPNAAEEVIALIK